MVLHPVGPLPATTYWRRRLVLLLALVALALVARSCVGGGSDGRNASAHPTPSTTPRVTHAPTPTATRPTGPVTCRDSALTLTASSDAPAYAAGSAVRFTLTVKNVSSVSCRRDLGAEVLEVLVYSGADRIWSSDDCGDSTGTAVQQLRPGASLETTLTWFGKRSAKGCSGSKAEAKPGTYTVRARVGTLRSGATVFHLTA